MLVSADFDLGLERAGFEIAWQVEIDPYCQRVLAKHWPQVTRYGDIRAIDWGTVPRVDVLCGGFPCQDLSFAGKRAGIDGERSGLWSEYVRAIRALRPRYILVENVPGLLTNQYMGRVLGDLAQSGYDAEWDCLPAAAFGAPHRRDRVWLLSYPSGDAGELQPSERKDIRNKSAINGQAWGTADVADSESITERARLCTDEPAEQRWRRLGDSGGTGDIQHSDGARLEGRRKGLSATASRWPIEPAVGRMAYGVPHRVDRLRGLGNAIVPQIAEFLGRRIMEIENADMHRMPRD